MSDKNTKKDFKRKIEINFNMLQKAIFVRADNSFRVFYLNKLMPFFNFLNNFPESFIAILSELDELHEIELYDRLFFIKQAEKKIINSSYKDNNLILRLKNQIFIKKNKISINFNKKILYIFFKKSNPRKI